MSAAAGNPISSAGPGRGPREERYRLAAIAAGVPVALLAVPLCAPIHGRSLIEEASHEPVPFLIVLGLVLWSFLTGGISLVYGLRRRVPGGPLFTMPAVTYALASGGIVVLLLFALGREGARRQEPGAPLAALGCALAFYLLLRGFVRGGWERWAQLIAGVWLGQGTIATLLVFDHGSPLGPQEGAPWVLLFAFSALARIMLWTLWPRRGEAMLRRSAR